MMCECPKADSRKRRCVVLVLVLTEETGEVEKDWRSTKNNGDEGTGTRGKGLLRLQMLERYRAWESEGGLCCNDTYILCWCKAKLIRESRDRVIYAVGLRRVRLLS